MARVLTCIYCEQRSWCAGEAVKLLFGADPVGVSYCLHLISGMVLNKLVLKLFEERVKSNRNCLGQFRGIPWNQASDVHRGSALVTGR